jgi:hypothetical protein
MARRLLSAAVQIRPGPTQQQRELAALAGNTLTAQMPTDSEMREALAKLLRELEDMRLARTAGGAEWTVEEGSFAPHPQITPEGEVLLRGGIIITRPD